MLRWGIPNFQPERILRLHALIIFACAYLTVEVMPGRSDLHSKCLQGDVICFKHGRKCATSHYFWCHRSNGAGRTENCPPCHGGILLCRSKLLSQLRAVNQAALIFTDHAQIDETEREKSSNILLCLSLLTAQ